MAIRKGKYTQKSDKVSTTNTPKIVTKTTDTSTNTTTTTPKTTTTISDLVPDTKEATEIFEKQKKNDNIKREYAKENGYKLLEIKYDEYDNIEEILEKELHIKNIA